MENDEQKDNRNGGRGRAKGEEREDWHARRAIAQPAGGGQDRAKMGDFLSREITHALLGISLYSLDFTRGEFRPTEKGQLSEGWMSVIREM